MKSLIITIGLVLSNAIFIPFADAALPPFYSKTPFVITAFDETERILYIGTNNGLITVDKYSRKINFLTKKNSQLPCDQVTSIACTWDGKAFIGTQNGILSRDKTGYHLLTSENSNLTDTHITALAIDPTDYLWVGTKNEGLFKSRDESNQDFKAIPIEFNNESIYSIAFDKLGYAWVVFQQGDLACLLNGEWYTYPVGQPIENIILKNSGKFLLHTPQCTYLSDGSSYKKIPILSNGRNITSAYYEPKYSKFIVSYDDGIYVIDADHPDSVPEIIPYSALINSIKTHSHTKKSKAISQAIEDAYDSSLNNL